ncbi:hypothetical protein PISL3812_09794 [Talaromyces islandicus]|uniref:CHAT domain-containing protein n=1 Tax=Talaromyces islandicus TaxID=28573 RepID=A0A0U1MAU7_TALIS|nr:hypothetical protein PISL3812_09794 [Talaromyces islandicus]
MSSYSPSIKAMIQAHRRPQAPSIYCRAGAPDCDGRDPWTVQAAICHRRGGKDPRALPRHVVDTAELHQYKADVESYLLQCNIFHFAGHGYTHPSDPSISPLLLEDGDHDPLTVGRLFELNLWESSPFLAYLSACGTGRIRDEKFIDENMARMAYEEMRDGNKTDESVCRGLHHASSAFRDRWLTALQTRRRCDQGSDIQHENGETISLDWVPYVHFGVYLQSVPEVTEIAKAHATSRLGLSLLIHSLVFLDPYRDGDAWYEQSSTCTILMRGILDAFVQGLGCFPVTLADRIATLGIISKLLPKGDDYSGPNVRVYVGYALLTAKVLQSDIGRLEHSLAELDKATGLDWENMPVDESETRSKEDKRNTKMLWFQTGDVFAKAVVFLADVDGLHNEKFIPMTFLYTCCECYNEGRGKKIWHIRAEGNEWEAANSGEAEKRRPVWKNIAFQLQSAAWESLEAPAPHPSESIALAIAYGRMG